MISPEFSKLLIVPSCAFLTAYFAIQRNLPFHVEFLPLSAMLQILSLFSALIVQWLRSFERRAFLNSLSQQPRLQNILNALTPRFYKFQVATFALSFLLIFGHWMTI